MYLEKFPIKLKKLREANNLTQNELADILHTTKQAISSYESGKNKPSLNALIRLSEHFNISLDSLVFDKKVDNNFNLYNDESEIVNHLLDMSLKIDSILNTISSKKNIKMNINSKNDIEFSNEISTDIIDIKNYMNTDDTIRYREIHHLGDVAAGNPCYAPGNILNTYHIKETLLNPSKKYYILSVKGDSMNKIFNDKDLILVECTNSILDSDIAITLVNNEEATVKKVKFDDDYISLIPMSTNQIHKIKKYKKNEVCIQGKVKGNASKYINP